VIAIGIFALSPESELISPSSFFSMRAPTISINSLQACSGAAWYFQLRSTVSLRTGVCCIVCAAM
jgi:hypothetical protein